MREENRISTNQLHYREEEQKPFEMTETFINYELSTLRCPQQQSCYKFYKGICYRHTIHM